MRWSGARGLRLLIVGALSALALPVDPRPVAAARCGATLARYHLVGRMRIEHTPLNAGNGTYRVGPGEIRLRFHDRQGESGPVEMLAYKLSTNYSFTVSVIGMRTTVAVRAVSRAKPDGSGVVASGHVQNGMLVWSTPVRGYTTAGTVICSGAMCGRFGLPPPGATRFSDGPAQVQFKPFRFHLGDARRFIMESTEMPSLRPLHARVAVALAGHALERRCAPAR